jgi:hypothetical protein
MTHICDLTFIHVIFPARTAPLLESNACSLGPYLMLMIWVQVLLSVLGECQLLTFPVERQSTWLAYSTTINYCGCPWH